MINRLQGTDGVRRDVRLSSDPAIKGMTPLQAFVEKGFITEEFMELYTFCHVTDLIESGEMKNGEDIIIGWDPRDLEGIFTSAAVNGIRKGGGRAVVLKIVPTPLVPIYMRYRGAKGGFMITASHNPKGQNGIKIFKSTGLKFFPEDDIRLTEKFKEIEYDAIKGLKLTGGLEYAHDDSIRVFTEFSCDYRNSWVKESNIFSKIILIVDPANGSLSGIAADVFNRMGFKGVIEASNYLNGDVNLNCGVVALEGVSSITPEMIKIGGRFEKNKAINKIFEIGREKREEIKRGEIRVSGAIFDADGDRFYRVDYNPFDDIIIVLSGDETAFLQAMYLMEKNPERYRGALYVNTVESDINTAIAAEKIGFKPVITGVGDKWLLREAVQFKDKFAIGSEESGHNITEGYLKTKDNKEISIFTGNGLKSAINTFAASESILSKSDTKSYFQKLHSPFEHGFKKTFYIYGTDKSKLAKGTPLWKDLEIFIRKSCLEKFENSVELSLKEKDEEPDMLYLAIYDKGDRFAPLTASLRGCIFARNSGTEDKTGINVRGSTTDMDKLIYIGERASNYLIPEMKI
jgi:phosphomannomutase